MPWPAKSALRQLLLCDKSIISLDQLYAHWAIVLSQQLQQYYPWVRSTWSLQLNICVILQVAERSLFLWNNEYIVTLVAQHRQVILPVVFNALESNARSHWNPAVHGLTSNVKKVFQDMDLNLWRECEAHYQQEEVCKSVLSLVLPDAKFMHVNMR